MDYVIPGNDDSSQAIRLYARGVADAILEGRSQIVHETVYGGKDLDYDLMIKEYRYNHRVYHEKDMERMDKIIELMDEINKKTKDLN